MTKEAMAKVLRYKADHIKTKIKPKFFAEVADTLERQPCDDCVSRQAALDIYDDYNVAVENGKLEAYRKHRKRLLKLPSIQPKYNTDEWCHDCSEYDHDKHCCPRYNKVIRNAVEETKQPKTHWISYWDEEARCYVYKCPECGNKQPFDTKHCWECGTKLSEISTGSESEET